MLGAKRLDFLRCSRFPSSTLLLLFFFFFFGGGLLIKAEYWEKGYPYYQGVTGEPSV